MKYLKIFTDFLDVTASLSDGALGRLFRAMLRYAREGAAPELKGKEAVAWVVARQHIDREAEAYENTVEARREAGRRSGQARKQKEQAATTTNKTNKTNQDKDKDKEKDNDKDKDKDKDSLSSGGGAAPGEREKKPTLEEVMAFSQREGIETDVSYFYNYYEANGWRMGRNPMRDWKAALRAWAKKTPSQPAGQPRKTSYMDEFKGALEILSREEAQETWI